MTEALNIAIIGSGKVGQSLCQLIRQTTHKVRLVGRSLEQQRSAVTQADITLLTINDDNIETLCRQLTESFKPRSIVAHCSGALGSEVLNSARQQHCHLASVHPLNTFPSIESSLSTFRNLDHGTYLYSEGDKTALEALTPLAKTLGFIPVVLSSDAKTNYHAACVFACNYLTALMDISLNTAQAAGLDRDQFWQAIQPLIQSTLRNISDHGTLKSLSGPIARGDHATIERHLSCLGDSRTPYKQFGLYALRLAAQRGELSAEQIAQMETLLT